MKIKYVGLSDVHSIRKSDWNGISEELGGPVEADAVTFDASNGFTADVPKEAGAWLLEHMPSDFKEATDEEASTTAAKSKAKS